MTAADEFLQEVQRIGWFEHGREAGGRYHVINSIFEAYDFWNPQMLKTWEPQITHLESLAIRQIGDAGIDGIFSLVSSEIGDRIWEKWGCFVD